MAFENWRGSVGIIKPTLRPGSMEDLIRILPDGIGVVITHINITTGKETEFREVLPHYEERVAELARAEVELIHPAGAPPFFLLGYQGEQELLRGWEAKYKTPIMTNGTNQIAAMKALGIRSFVGVSYFPDPEINRHYANYFRGAGFDVRAMEGMQVAFNEVQDLSSRKVYGFIRKLFLQHRDVDGIYMLGSGWRTLDIVEMMEMDFGKPVVHHITAQSWEIQKRLFVRQPIEGYGRLLAEMP
jgi:maleate cis-trans isomerase